MPLYVFENQEHGVRAELPFAVEDRPDAIVLRRKTVPDTVAIAGSATNEIVKRNSWRECMKRAEERGLLKEGPRKSILTEAEKREAGIK